MSVVDQIRTRASSAPTHAAMVGNDRSGGATVESYAEMVGNFDAVAKQLRAEGLRTTAPLFRIA